jgi:hypothetical protein
MTKPRFPYLVLAITAESGKIVLDDGGTPFVAGF